MHSGQAGTCDDTVGAKPDGTNDVCGGDFTSGHYDPNRGCGGASTARSSDLCVDEDGDVVPASGNGDPPGNYPFAAGVIASGSGGCEVGDLSNGTCGNGKLIPSASEIASGKITGSAHGPCPACDAEYLKNPSTADRKGAFN